MESRTQREYYIKKTPHHGIKVANRTIHKSCLFRLQRLWSRLTLPTIQAVFMETWAPRSLLNCWPGEEDFTSRFVLVINALMCWTNLRYYNRIRDTDKQVKIQPQNLPCHPDERPMLASACSASYLSPRGRSKGSLCHWVWNTAAVQSPPRR